MSEWKEAKLGEVTIWSSGGTPSKEISEYWNGEIPWISAKSMKTIRINDSENYITPQGLNNGSRLANKDTILLLVRGSELFNRIPVCIAECDVAFNQDVKAIKSNEDILQLFLFYWFLANANLLKAKVESTGIGAGKLDTKVLHNLVISYPPIDEQLIIIKKIKALDDKIENNRRICEKLEEMAQAIFKQWFVEFNFPDDNGEPYKDNGGEMVESELGLIPKGWEVSRADDIYDIAIGKTPPRKEQQWFETQKSQSNTKWISIKDLGNSGMYIFDTSEYLTNDSIEKFNVKRIPKNSILLSFKLTIGRIAITTEEMLSNEAIAHFVVEDKKNMLEFTYLTLKNYDYAGLGSTSSIATAINSKIVKAMPIILANKITIQKFHEITSPIFKMICNFQKENNKLVESRDALLPKLMSGEIDVEGEG